MSRETALISCLTLGAMETKNFRLSIQGSGLEKYETKPTAKNKEQINVKYNTGYSSNTKIRHNNIKHDKYSSKNSALSSGNEELGFSPHMQKTSEP